MDIFFPIFCLDCGKENQWLCERCLEQIKIQTEWMCPICESKIAPSGQTCIACKRKSSLDGLLTCCSYQDPLVAKMIHLYKYRFVKDFHLPLAKLMLKVILKTDLPLPDIIIPIPLHQRRLRWRGFNQSLLLAQYLAANILPALRINCRPDILVRNRYTMPQMKIQNIKQRQKNIFGAFAIENQELIKNKRILLVDDVATTGATILECAKVLKSTGAKEIYGIVIARQEFKN